MNRSTLGFLALVMVVVLGGCSGGFLQQQEGDSLNPDPPGSVEQPVPGGNVSENPGGELNSPDLQEEGYFTTGDLIDTVYIPYVEDVSIPETIIAGQPFEVRLILSTALDPDLLNGISREYAMPYFTYSGDNSIDVCVYLGENPSSYQPVYEHTVRFHQYMVRGEKDSLGVYTADSPEWGGIAKIMNLTQGTFMDTNEHLTYREYPITVQPAEE